MISVFRFTDNVQRNISRYMFRLTNMGIAMIFATVVYNWSISLLPPNLLKSLFDDTITRAGHVPTFLKSFRSVLERGPSDKSFRSRSFFVVSFRYVPFRPVPFRSE